MIGPMTLEMATKTVKWKLCSGCYGALQMDPDPENEGGYLVTCVNCGAGTRGYISQKTVEMRRAQSYSDAREVRRMLIRNGYMPDPLAGESTQEKLKKLGF